MGKKSYALVCIIVFWVCFIVAAHATAENISKPASATSVKPTLPVTKSDPVLNSKKDKGNIKHHTVVKKKSSDKSGKLTKVKWKVKPRRNEYSKRGW